VLANVLSHLTVNMRFIYWLKFSCGSSVGSLLFYLTVDGYLHGNHFICCDTSLVVHADPVHLPLGHGHKELSWKNCHAV
jgi:hypothetical protein